jgi:hypothetical protein
MSGMRKCLCECYMRCLKEYATYNMSGIWKCLCECYMRCLKRISYLEYERNEKMFVWMLHEMFEKNKLLIIRAEYENVYVNVTWDVWKE